MRPGQRQRPSWWMGWTSGLIMGVGARVMGRTGKRGCSPLVLARTGQRTARLVSGSSVRSPEGRAQSAVEENCQQEPRSPVFAWGPLHLPPWRGCGRPHKPVSRKALGKTECNHGKCKWARPFKCGQDAEICCPFTVLQSLGRFLKQDYSVGWGPTYHSGQHPPSLPGWAVKPQEPAGWGRARNLWLLEGLLILSGTACLPPSGLLKSLEDS